MGLLVLTAWLAFALRPAIVEAQQAALREHVLRLDAVPLPQAEAASLDQRDALRDELPGEAAIGSSIARLVNLGVSMDPGFALAPLTIGRVAPALVRVQFTIRLVGDYAQVRAWLAHALDSLPNAALDGLELTRPAQGGRSLHGTLRWSLYFQQGEE